jgi:drug/metabolite transporter (DMT)-like permease
MSPISVSTLPILFALCSNLAFSIATIYYTQFTRRLSAEWVNFFKAFVAFICFFIVCLIGNVWTPIPGSSFLLLVASGFLGLFIGDIFLLKAFAHLGPARVLMLLAFQPLILAGASYYLFGQSTDPQKFLAIFFLIGCVYVFALESYKKSGKWELTGILLAFGGILLDASGILLTRSAFAQSQDLSPFLANLIRCGTTILAFLAWRMIPKTSSPIPTLFPKFSRPDLLKIVFASILGTFVSLSLYIFAVRDGHLSSITAVSGTAPILAGLLESIMGKRKWSPYLLVGTALFVLGFIIIIS